MRYLLIIILFISCVSDDSIISPKNSFVNADPIMPSKNATNVVFILTDDLGYGDVQVYNSQSQIPTPNINELAEGGLRFTDAHSNSSVCTPTRYGVLTGTYAWRTKLKRGVLHGFSPPLIKPETVTIAQVFKSKGYKTACIGKWHLGMTIPLIGESKEPLDSEVDVSKPISDGPINHGFDYFFGISASLDFSPYGFIENDRFIEKFTQRQKKIESLIYARPGTKGTTFNRQDCLDMITKKAKSYLNERKKNKEKFFLYLPITAPHKPVLPNAQFEGKTNLGSYGDFVAQVDWTVGEIVKELKKLQMLDNTMIIVTSDNGSFMHNLDNLDRIEANRAKKIRELNVDHSSNSTIQGYYSKNHRPNYIYRGTKADIWEAGHRVPFIVYWNKGIKDKGRVIDTTICLTDFFATACDLINYQNSPTEGIDSYSFLPLIKNQQIKPRLGIIHHSIKGIFAIRQGDWKLVLGNGSGGREIPRGKAFNKPYYLFNMKSDSQETHNFIDQRKNIAQKLEDEFKIIFNTKERIQN